MRSGTIHATNGAPGGPPPTSATFTALGLIVERPNIGLVLEGLDDAYRKRLIGSHVVFYRVLNNRVEIDRIPHQNMDATQHLRDS
jgi:plasmid stabilization system protein ParE